MNIVYFGTDNNSKLVLKDIVSSENKVVLVITTKDAVRSRGNKKTPSAVKEYCIKNNLNCIEKIPDYKQVEALNPDIIIVASYGKIIPEKIINCSTYGTINLHPSLLPKYRGPTPVHSAILNNEKITGTSIILLNNDVDAGPIILQEKYKINNNEYLNKLTTELFKIGAKNILKILNNPKLILKAINQNENIATYTNKINKKDGRINWNQSGDEIIQLIKAFSENPGTYSFLDNKKIKIFKARFLENNNQKNEIGKLGQSNDNELFVSINKGIIIVDEIQLEGKNRISGVDFVRGYQVFQKINNEKIYKKLS
jgi:methionyl-tRNA formyltransferase